MTKYNSELNSFKPRFFSTKFVQTRYFHYKKEKVNITIKFNIFESVYVPKFI